MKDFGSIIKNFTDDVFEEFNKDHLMDFENLEKVEQKKLLKLVGNNSATLLKMNIKKIMGGEF